MSESMESMDEAEYNDLLEQVRGLNPDKDDVLGELLEGSRYGETHVVRAILEVFPSLVDATDPSQHNASTALHMACANGHDRVVAWILEKTNDALRTNASGNTPLHWAAANGHDKVVEILLQRIPNVNVLQKNHAGRSILTEGFSSQNTRVAQLLLEHDSASEDKLVQGNNGNNNNNNKEEEETIVHVFDLNHMVLSIRELAMPERPLGEEYGDPLQDTTGYAVWPASIVMAQWLLDHDMPWDHKPCRVLELGAGCGVPGLALSQKPNQDNIRSITLTDWNPTTMDNLKHNAELNQDDRLRVCAMDWNDTSTWPKEWINDNDDDDDVVRVVLGSDLIYQASMVPILTELLDRLSCHVFLYVCPDAKRDGATQFLQETTDRWRCVSQREAPPRYQQNPLQSRDDEACFVHFHLLQNDHYTLYHFEKKKRV